MWHQVTFLFSLKQLVILDTKISSMPCHEDHLASAAIPAFYGTEDFCSATSTSFFLQAFISFKISVKSF